MSKTVSGATEANIGINNNFVRCFLVKQRISGIVQGFTEHDKNLTKDLSDGNGEITYKAAASFVPKAIVGTNSFAVDNTEVEGVLDPTAFLDSDVHAGVYDRAEIKIFLLDWKDTSLDAIALRRGFIGEISTGEKSFKAELRGMLQRYSEEIIEIYTPDCMVDLGSTRCGERLNPPLWTATTAFTVRPVRDARLGSVVKPTAFNDRHFKCTTAGTSGASEPSWNLTLGGTTSDGTVTWTTIQARTIETKVTTVTNNREFVVDYTGDAPDAFLTGGLVKFQNRKNAGINMEIKTWTLSTKKLILFLPMPFTVDGGTDTLLLLEDGTGNLLLESGTDQLLLEDGDTIHIQAGCLKDVPTCRDTFDNIFNIIGFPYVPGIKVLFRTPNQQ